MQTEYAQEFKDLQRDQRLGFFKGIFATLALLALCGTVLYGAYRVQETFEPILNLIFEDPNG